MIVIIIGILDIVIYAVAVFCGVGLLVTLMLLYFRDFDGFYLR